MANLITRALTCVVDFRKFGAGYNNVPTYDLSVAACEKVITYTSYEYASKLPLKYLNVYVAFYIQRFCFLFI